MYVNPTCSSEEAYCVGRSQASIAEALLTCVFQGSVIWNSQMSPWQTNGNTGVMEVGTHALCRLLLCVGACDVTAGVCLDGRTYCNTEEQHEHRHLTQIQAIKLFMTGRRPHLKCKIWLRLKGDLEWRGKKNSVTLSCLVI